MKDFVLSVAHRSVLTLLVGAGLFCFWAMDAHAGPQCYALGGICAPGVSECQAVPNRTAIGPEDCSGVCCVPSTAPPAPTGNQCSSSGGACKTTCLTTERPEASDCAEPQQCCVSKTCDELGGEIHQSPATCVGGDAVPMGTQGYCCVMPAQAAGSGAGLTTDPTGIQAMEDTNAKGKTVVKYGLQNPLGTRSVPEIVAAVIGWLSALAGSLFFLYLMWGGIQWMTARGEEEQVKAARQKILYAIFGIVVMLFSYFAVDALIGITNVIR